MKVLITGATGLIGKELTHLFIQNGHEVHYLSTTQKKIKSKPHCTGFYWNPQLGIFDENALMGVDVIIHLAGASIAKRWTKSYKQEIYESRILPAHCLLKALKNHPHQVGQIITASAIGIYPNSPTARYDEETQAYENSFLANVVSKWEETVDKFQLLDIKVCKLRIGMVLSAKAGAFFTMLQPLKKGIATIMGSGTQIQSWIHTQDLAAMFYFAATQQLQGTYNAVAPNPVTQKELIQTMRATLKNSSIPIKIPKILLKWSLGEMHQLLFESHNVSSLKIEKEGFKFRFRDISKAVDDLIT